MPYAKNAVGYITIEPKWVANDAQTVDNHLFANITFLKHKNWVLIPSKKQGTIYYLM